MTQDKVYQKMTAMFACFDGRQKHASVYCQVFCTETSEEEVQVLQ